MTFPRLPVVHLKGGLLEEFPGEDPSEVLAHLARKARPVYVVDLDGLHRNQAHLELIQAASRRAPLWVDAGSRYVTDVMDLFVAGAERVTVRWNPVHQFKELEDAAALSEEVFLGVEFNGAFVDNPREPAQAPSLLFRRAEELGLGVVVIDLQARGRPQIDSRLASTGSSFRGAKWYAGGLGDPYDRETLESWAYSGMLVPAAVMVGQPDMPEEGLA